MSFDERFRDRLNFRDLGGLECEDGRKVKEGLFYRGVQLDRFNKEELEEFRKLKMKTIMDLRSKQEIEKTPDPYIDGANVIEHSGLVVKGCEDIDWSPAGMRKIGGAAQDQLNQIRGYYKKIAIKNEAFRLMMKEVEEGNLPLYFHCMTGKDRTGVAAIVLLLALGVKEEEIRKDYLASNIYRKDILKESLASVAEEAKGHPELAHLVQIQDGVSEEIFDTVISSIYENYGNVENYLYEDYGLDREKINALQQKYLISK